jgi:hypothetical protein
LSRVTWYFCHVYVTKIEKNQFEPPLASIPSISFLQLIAFPQRPFLERFTTPTL